MEENLGGLYDQLAKRDEEFANKYSREQFITAGWDDNSLRGLYDHIAQDDQEFGERFSSDQFVNAFLPEPTQEPTQAETPQPVEQEAPTFTQILQQEASEEDEWFFQPAIDYVNGVWNMGRAQGRIGNKFEVDELLSGDGADHLSDDDLNSVASDFRLLREAGEATQVGQPDIG